MSAIPPPVVGIEEVNEVRIESGEVLERIEREIRAERASMSPRRVARRRGWLGSPAGLAVFGAASALAAVAYALRGRKLDKTAALLVVPTLGWLLFAVALSGEIVRRNRRGIRGRLARN